MGSIFIASGDKFVFAKISCKELTPNRCAVVGNVLSYCFSHYKYNATHGLDGLREQENALTALITNCDFKSQYLTLDDCDFEIAVFKFFNKWFDLRQQQFSHLVSLFESLKGI